MKQFDRVLPLRNWMLRTATSIRDRLRLSWAGMVALAGALVVVGTAGVVLVAVGQDVIAGDGFELRDASNLDSVIAHRTDALVAAAHFFTDVGSVAVLLLVAVAAAGVLWFRGTRLVVAIAPLVSLGVAGACVGATKHLVDRARPPVPLHLVAESDASFPSGHAADSTALLLALALVIAVVVFRRPLARALVVGFAGVCITAVGMSRLLLGVHYPTDVIVGWALGTVVAVTVTTVMVLLAHQQPVLPGGTDRRVRLLLLRLRRPVGAASRSVRATPLRAVAARP